ncbi:MAG: hypothetical protein HOW73_47500 [Polyangiaceae bacterium]|nr:hypothetical protein [Polyangiaceae bacterium]
MIPTVKGQRFPTKEELIRIYLRSIAAGAARRGITVNVLPGSEYHLRAEACAQMVVVAFANQKLAITALSPLDADENTLPELASVFGVKPRPAGPAAGAIVVRVTTGTVTIPAEWVFTLDNGKKYKTVSINTNVADLDEIDAIAIDGGADTNRGAGAKGTWDDGSVTNLGQGVTVAAGGLDGGANADTTEVLRGRLLDRLSAPGTGGNWSHVKQLAENASASIGAVWVYPGIQGAGSYGIAAAKATGDRELASSIISLMASAVVAELPGHAKLNATTVAEEGIDMVLSAKLALPSSAGGKGGGWRDPVPWPNPTSGAVRILSFDEITGFIETNSTVLNGLAVGTHFGIWDWGTETMHEFTVQSLSTLGPNITIRSVEGFSKDFTACYISAGAEKLIDYAADLLTSMRSLGPGEKTASMHLLPQAARKPTTDASWPKDLTSRVLSAVTDNHLELQSLDYEHRFETGTTTPRTSPSVPTATTDPPNILVLKHMAIQQAA